MRCEQCLLNKKIRFFNIFNSSVFINNYMHFIDNFSYIFAMAQSAGTRIHKLHLYRGVRPNPNECPRYDTKQFGGELSIIHEI